MATTASVEGARQRIRAMTTSAVDGAEFRDGVLYVLHGLVPWDGAVLSPFDPATTLPTGGTGVGVDLADCRAALELEYRYPDVGRWTDLAHDATGAAVLSERLRGDLMRSVRFRDLYRGQGWRDELRVAFRSSGTCWGGVSLLRARRAEFTATEVNSVCAVQDTVAEGLRALVLRGVTEGLGGSDLAGPAVITVDGDGRIEGRTAAALELLSRVADERAGESGLLAPVQSVVARQRASTDGTARVRLRGRDGGWLVMQAGSLRSPDGVEGTVVTIEPARPPEIVSIAAAIIGLTPRETEVLEHLLAGRSSVDIGRRLYLSPHTVNDHVRHIFEKAGVSSRMELTAWLFFGQYAPRLSGKGAAGESSPAPRR